MQPKNNIQSIKNIPEEIIFNDFQQKHRLVRDYSFMNMWDFPYVRKDQTICRSTRFKPLAEETKKGYELFYVCYDKIEYKTFKCTYYYLNKEEKTKGRGDSSINQINNTLNNTFLVPKNAIKIKRIRLDSSDYYNNKKNVQGGVLMLIKKIPSKKIKCYECGKVTFSRSYNNRYFCCYCGHEYNNGFLDNKNDKQNISEFTFDNKNDKQNISEFTFDSNI